MKIKPKIYAEALVESLGKEKPVEDIAKNFWRLLQKNKQYKDLTRILEAVDQTFAEKNDLVLALVYSSSDLPENRLKEIKIKLKSRFKKDVMIKNIVKPSLVAGVIVKVGDQEINLSLDNKIKRLKQKLTSI